MDGLVGTAPAAVRPVLTVRPEQLPPREIGRFVGRHPGPTLVAVGSLHGNEPSGSLALERVLLALRGREEGFAGELVAVRGNLGAIARRQRYLARDLNRRWSVEGLQHLQAPGGMVGACAEDHEQVELFEALAEAFRRARGRTYALDLHSTSGGGPPFVVMCDTLPNRALAQDLPVPKVLGLEEQLEGTLLSLLSDLGHVTVAFEAGQHDSPEAVDHAEAAVWIALRTAGMLIGSSIAPSARALSQLQDTAGRLPGFVEARYRHEIEPEDRFRMLPGFESFQPVRESQVLAEDRHGAVRAPEDGLILMPLYQPQGDDGFFLVKPFNPVWLKISAALRYLRADRVVHWLPGVSRHPDRPATYRVNRKIARWYALEIFHLLGFRRAGEEGRSLLVARRPHDVEIDRQVRWWHGLPRRRKRSR